VLGKASFRVIIHAKWCNSTHFNFNKFEYFRQVKKSTD
jgi:hypothetical protein